MPQSCRSVNSEGRTAPRRTGRHSVALLLAVTLCEVRLGAGEELSLKLEPKEVLQKRLEAGGVPLKDRQAVIRQMFEQAGCRVTEQPVNKKFANVICSLPGQIPSTIIVGGHYDFPEEGRGIVDDWSGTALLPSLYEALKNEPRKHSYQFVAFAAEEQGLIGSDYFVKKMTAEQRENTLAFVNLECLGLTPPKVWVSRSTPMLVGRLGEIANAIRVPLQGVNVDKVGDDDTHPFLNKKMPVISIHSVTSETFPILHSKRDNLEAVHMSDYFDAYRLVAFYLAYLDVKLN
jgi:peptidase M28-like protein